MEDRGFIMYCGEQDGDLALSYIEFRASEVRRRVALLFNPALEVGWRAARREGWRVARIVVRKHRGCAS